MKDLPRVECTGIFPHARNRKINCISEFKFLKRLTFVSLHSPIRRNPVSLHRSQVAVFYLQTLAHVPGCFCPYLRRQSLGRQESKLMVNACKIFSPEFEACLECCPKVQPCELPCCGDVCCLLWAFGVLCMCGLCKSKQLKMVMKLSSCPLPVLCNFFQPAMEFVIPKHDCSLNAGF